MIVEDSLLDSWGLLERHFLRWGMAVPKGDVLFDSVCFAYPSRPQHQAWELELSIWSFWSAKLSYGKPQKTSQNVLNCFKNFKIPWFFLMKTILNHIKPLKLMACLRNSEASLASLILDLFNQVLANVSLHCAAGKTTALVGFSGSGRWWCCWDGDGMGMSPSFFLG